MEQDSAIVKRERDYDTLDYNRANMPLVEITTNPDIKHPEDAIHLIIELIETLSNLKISNARMEQGELRVDTNISLKRKSDGFEGPRVEVKEIDRIRDIELAIDHEIVRQHELITTK